MRYIAREHSRNSEMYQAYYDEKARRAGLVEDRLSSWTFVLGEICTITNPEKMSALDIGCMTGGLCCVLLDRGFRPVYGIDIADAYISSATRKLGDLENLKDSIHFQKLAIEDAPNVLDCAFDFVVSLELLDHLQNIYVGVNSIAMLTKEGGKAVISIELDYANDKSKLWDIKHSDCGYLLSLFEERGLFVLRMEIREGRRSPLLFVSLLKGKKRGICPWRSKLTTTIQ